MSKNVSDNIDVVYHKTLVTRLSEWVKITLNDRILQKCNKNRLHIHNYSQTQNENLTNEIKVTSTPSQCVMHKTIQLNVLRQEQTTKSLYLTSLTREQPEPPRSSNYVSQLHSTSFRNTLFSVYPRPKDCFCPTCQEHSLPTTFVTLYYSMKWSFPYVNLQWERIKS